MKKIILLLACIAAITSCKEKSEKTESKKPTLVKNPKDEYLTRGSIEACETGKVISFQTMLPELKTGSYYYYKFYNISKPGNGTAKPVYAVLAVMEISGINPDPDLTTYDAAAIRKFQPNSANTVNIDDIDKFSSVDLSAIDVGDKITLICFHDDDFATTNVNNHVLNFYMSRLPDIYEYERDTLKSYTKLEKERRDREPKKGNGGILNVIDCQ